MIYCLLVCILFIWSSIISAMSIDIWNQYAAKLPEYPPIIHEDMDWNDPDYTEFLKTMRPSMYDRVLSMVTISQRAFIPHYLYEIITKVYAYRKANSFDTKHTALLAIDKATTLYVFGDMHANFHSLLRDLNWLYQNHTIDEFLCLRDSNVYLVFHGDQIDRGPYSMETLALIATLMDINPHNVLYIKGNHESNQYWHNFGLKRELIFRSGYIDSDLIPCNHLLSNFFDTLEDELFIASLKNHRAIVAFKFNGIDEPYIKKVLFNDEVGITHITSTDLYTTNTTDAFDTVALIKTEEWAKGHRAKKGLSFLDQTFGVTTWAFFCSPLITHQMYYNVNYDAIGKINLDPENIAYSTIQTVVHDIAEKHNIFTEMIARNIVTGRLITEVNQGIATGKPIVISSNLALMKSVAIMSERVKMGISIAFNEQNEQGGIHGRHLKFDARNDGYLPYKTRANIKHMHEFGITDIFLCSTGSPTLESTIDEMKSFSILNFCPITGDPLFLKSDLKGLINLTGSYDAEMEAHFDYLINECLVKKFAFFYQIEGLSTLMECIRQILPNKGITSWIEIPFVKGTLHFNKEIQKLKSSAVEAVGILTVADSGRQFIKEAGIEFMNTKMLFGHSFLGDTGFRQFIKQQGLTMRLGRRVPLLELASLPIVSEYQAAMKAYNCPMDADSFEGYMSARFLMDIMLMCDEVSKEAIVSKVESLTNFNWRGLNLTFDPTTRSLFSKVWIEAI